MLHVRFPVLFIFTVLQLQFVKCSSSTKSFRVLRFSINFCSCHRRTLVNLKKNWQPLFTSFVRLSLNSRTLTVLLYRDCIAKLMHRKWFERRSTLMLVFPTLRSPLPIDFSLSTCKLISVIKLYRKVTVSFLVLQTGDLAVVFLCRSNLAGDIGSTMISYPADGNWKSSSKTTVLSAAFFWMQSAIAQRDVSFIYTFACNSDRTC